MSKKTAQEIAEPHNLSGKTVLITGCNSGIGFETMRVLASRGARIIGLARTLEKAEQACKKVTNNYLPVKCEMSDKDSLKLAVKAVNEPIDLLIANAGVMWIQEKTIHYEVESHFFINHLAHFYIVTSLMKHLTSTAKVIVLSSAAHSFVKGKGLDLTDLSWNRKYSPWTAYALSKLANLLFVKSLSKRLQEKQSAFAVHPGIIDSNLWRNSPDAKAKYPLKTVEYGASTPVFLSVNNNLTSGAYYTNCKIGKASKISQITTSADELYRKSEELITTIF